MAGISFGDRSACGHGRGKGKEDRERPSIPQGGASEGAVRRQKSPPVSENGRALFQKALC